MRETLRLTRELIDQIVFGMENQDRDFYLDTERAVVVSDDQVDLEADPERYVPVPEWQSVDGYNLMEQFIASLHNPVFRERLRSILASGKGVFRQFKDTVRERREIERLWFRFKERSMSQLVIDWFNDLREREGLERLESMVSDTETDELVESDFTFTAAEPRHLDRLEAFDRAALEEIYGDPGDPIADLYRMHARTGVPELDDDRSQVIVAETGGGELAGCIRGVRFDGERASLLSVVTLYVVPEYRGLGVGRSLFRHFCLRAHEQGRDQVLLDLPGRAADVEESFAAYGMQRHSTALRMDLHRWRRDWP